MTIWAFGDSFIDSYDYKKEQRISDYDTWLQTIGKKLNQEVKNYGCVGSSLDFTYYKFNSIRSHIKKNDIVIFAATNLSRRWLRKEWPYLTQITDLATLDIDKDFVKAIKYYILHLDHPELYQTYLTTFLYNLKDITEDLNLHTLVIPCMEDTYKFLLPLHKNFPTLHWAQGYLDAVNIKEYDSKLNRINTIEDGKINHLCWSNHNILADKILDNINDNKILDLETGFCEYLITKDTVKDPAFHLKELAFVPNYGS